MRFECKCGVFPKAEELCFLFRVLSALRHAEGARKDACKTLRFRRYRRSEISILLEPGYTRIGHDFCMQGKVPDVLSLMGKRKSYLDVCM